MKRWLGVLGAVALAFVASGCLQYVAPSGRAPLRYRDLVFSNFVKTANITYGSAVDENGDTVALKLDTYAPAGDTVARRPAIVWVHGGSFAFGSKTSAEIVDEAQTFARKGYFNASINYRLRPSGCSAGAPDAACVGAIVDALADAQAAVRYVRDNANALDVDPNRIAIAGTSAGAITALNVLYNGNDAGAPARSSVRAAVSLSGAQVLGRINRGDPPALLLHGTNDRLVPYAWATRTVDRANAVGSVAALTTWEGAGHVPYVDKRAQIHAHTTNFLYSALNLAGAAR
jgi:acetyl esterase/lipase